MAITKLKLSENDVSVTIDLEKLFGKAANDQAVREVFFEAALDQMMQRLSSGKDYRGRAMPKYSQRYKDSVPYHVFGKDGTVNMELTGDMLASLQIQKQNGREMTVGFTGSLENKKAYAHMTGFKGHKYLDGKVDPRLFFGWTDEALVTLANKIKPQTDEQSIFSDEKLLALLDRLTS